MSRYHNWKFVVTPGSRTPSAGGALGSSGSLAIPYPSAWITCSLWIEPVVTEGGGGLRIYDLSGVDTGAVPLVGNVVGG